MNEERVIKNLFSKYGFSSPVTDDVKHRIVKSKHKILKKSLRGAGYSGIVIFLFFLKYRLGNIFIFKKIVSIKYLILLFILSSALIFYIVFFVKIDTPQSTGKIETSKEIAQQKEAKQVEIINYKMDFFRIKNDNPEIISSQISNRINSKLFNNLRVQGGNNFIKYYNRDYQKSKYFIMGNIYFISDDIIEIRANITDWKSKIYTSRIVQCSMDNPDEIDSACKSIAAYLINKYNEIQ